MHRIYSALVLSLVLVDVARAAETAAPEILLYSDARHTLIQRGFHPYTMPGAASCDEEGPRCYPELVGCRHKRLWICDYAWKAGTAIFQAETHSDVPLVDSFYCLVNCAIPTEPISPSKTD